MSFSWDRIGSPINLGRRPNRWTAWPAGLLKDRVAGESDFLYHQGDKQTGFAIADVCLQSAAVQGIARRTRDADDADAEH
jgi:hypothetical protein